MRTNSRSASWCIKRGVKEAEYLPLFLCKKRNQARLSPKSEKAELFSFGFRLTSAVGKACRGAGQVFKNMSAALFAKKCDSVNCEIAIESRRSEKVKLLKDSVESTCNSVFSLIYRFYKWIASVASLPRKDGKVESSLRDLTLGLAWRALRSNSFILANLFSLILWNLWNLSKILQNRWNL